jgi:hypothetical protein
MHFLHAMTGSMQHLAIRQETVSQSIVAGSLTESEMLKHHHSEFIMSEVHHERSSWR